MYGSRIFDILIICGSELSHTTFEMDAPKSYDLMYGKKINCCNGQKMLAVIVDKYTLTQHG